MKAQSIRDTVKEKIATIVKDNLKIDERDFVNPWSNQDKAAVLQQSRCFSDTPIDFMKCLNLLTRVMYLLQQGEKFTSQEMTKLFFDVTKLFQCQNTRLRRMLYLMIKELEPSENEVFICMSCLIKDMNSKNDSFRANSIRVLSRILDPAMAAQIDRYLKTAIVDKNPFVASSALVCGINLVRTSPDVVKRWVNEIQETVGSKHAMVQFHALALVYELKKTDRMALHKVVTQLAGKAQGKSCMAECLLIRYAAQTLMSDRDSGVEKTLMSYLSSCLRHKSDLVNYEAARAFCQLAVLDTDGGGTVLGHDMTPATTVLQISLTSPKPAVRFGAIRTLNMLAQHRPQMAAKCNCDMEPLLSDPNRNTATLALTTLLKTGHESNVERLVKQITTFMSDISDAYKIDVVRAVKGLCLQYPSKYKTLMGFLSTNLREDGTAEFKKDLVDAIILVISQVPDSREAGLLHLCEFIEDCEYPNLCTRILNFLGDEVPNTANQAKFIRFIYNRLILENAFVRAAAVDALTRIAMRCEKLRRDVLVLLQFGQNDNDDEVRERIGLYASVLEQSIEKGAEASDAFQTLMSVDIPFSVDAMYDGLLSHIDSDQKAAPFDFRSLPSEDAYKAQAKAQAAMAGGDKRRPGVPSAAVPGDSAAAAGQPAAAAAEQRAAANVELMRVVGEITGGADIGPLQHSCKPKFLTESEAEYTVQVIKHMFKQHVVLEMCVSNTVQGITLETIEVRLTGVDGATWIDLGASAISKLEYEEKGSAYVVLMKPGCDEVGGAVLGTFGAALHFVQKEEGDDLGYEDDYPVEAVSISVGDYMFPKSLPQGRFMSGWEALAAQGSEATDKRSLNFKTIESAVDYIVSTLHMEPCDKTGKAEAGARGHTLLMSGTFLGGHSTLVKALVGFAPQGCLALKITARAKSQMVCEAVVGALSA